MKYNIIDCSANSGVAYYVKNSLIKIFRKSNVEPCFIKLPSFKSSFYRGGNQFLKDGILSSLKFTLVFISILRLKKRDFMFQLLNHRVNTILVGDCIMSNFYRSPNTDVLPRKNLTLYLFYLKYII